MSVIDLTLKEFENTVFKNDIVFIDFWASWCAPCMAFAKVYEKVANLNKDIIFTKINIEHEAELAKTFSIQSIPHIIIFKQGIVIYSESGSMPQKTLNELIEQTKKADVSDIQKEK